MKETNDVLTFPLTDYIRDLQHDQSILNTPYIGDPPPGTIPQIGDVPFAPTPQDPIYTPSAPNYGWICPKCGRCLAPHMDSCPHCSEPTTINIAY